MTNNRKIRLIQVAKEFKVGLNTITDFLLKKGINSDGSPNSLVSPDVYTILEKEFGSNRSITGKERDSVREKISLGKKESVTINASKRDEKDEEQEVIIKSNIISVKDEVPQPKILGKIDLNPKKPEPQAAKPQPAPAPAKQEPKKVEPATVKEQPAAKVEESAKQSAEPAQEPKKDNVFRPGLTQLSGPQILGTMDVSGMVPGGKHKRKRLDKEKIDVSKQGKNGNGKEQKQENGKKNKGGQQQNHNQQGQPNQQNQPKPGEGRRNKKKDKHQPKPVVRPEVSDEEVSKQIKDTLARLTAKGAKNKGAKYRKEKREEIREKMSEEMEREQMERSVLKVTEFVTVSELATMMNVSPMEVISACMNLGLMVSINQRLDAEALVVVAEEFGFKTEFVTVEVAEAIDEEGDSEEDLVSRPPIVTVMGHVDHGKTSLLDNIRKTNVIEGEAGGITQHIGAYSVNYNGQKVTFLDTPGHEAFTAMRARGAKITDVAIIIVSADDSVMPQTVEAINHAQAAGVPMVFAINKIDKPAANPEHIKEQLAQMNYLVEEWGGKYQSQDISAKKGINLDKLLEKVLLEAEMLDLKANPNKKAQGSVIEST
ncbi:MAG: translation initiation factor IF-2 N-terminal domain-containing protein, partial [Alistipes sp.]|nr:translation initiation factor IF-2 N-terminal domain-containing protein [Alistipes sp.]